MKATASSHIRPRTARRRDSAGTRTAILGAAERIFAEAGLAGARTQTIAAAAGVNKAMLHYYFKSKRGLYRAVLEANVKELHRQMDEVFAAAGSDRTLLLDYVSRHFDFIAARPYYPRLFQRLAMAGDRSVERIIRVHLAPIYRALTELIEHGVRSGEFRPLDPRHTAISVVALTVFYFGAAPLVGRIRRIDVNTDSEQAQRKEEVLRFLRYALFNEPGGAEQ
jgi:TetR/AcrR family transcriptional regulator